MSEYVRIELECLIKWCKHKWVEPEPVAMFIKDEKKTIRKPMWQKGKKYIGDPVYIIIKCPACGSDNIMFADKEEVIKEEKVKVKKEVTGQLKIFKMSKKNV